MASIYKRSNGWGASVYYQLDGKDKRKVKSGFKTKSDAQKWAIEIEQQKNDNTLIVSEKLFIDQFKQWYSVFKEPKIAFQTKLWYRRTIRIIEEYWTNKKLSSVTTEQFQIMINDYSKSHVKSSVYRIKNIISGFTRYALDENLIRKDFTKNIYIVAGKKSKDSDLKFLEKDDFQKLVESCKKTDDLTAKMILTSAFTGMRYAEVAGLTPSDVNLEEKTISVNKSWDMVQNVFKPTKTTHSNRIITIPDELVMAVKGWELNHKFVFYGKNGFPPKNESCNKELKKILEANNSKVITMHGLRHTHASFLLANDISIQYVSERLGHANVNITLGIYAHLLNEKRLSENKKALDLLNKL
ncbi:Integrase/recombinase [Fructobacillus tropaeoli]|uniref:site-specific integrase n=1 Tax=Fructobacillus tropaeoli TaxID=709323 RepID=UPI002DA36A64|nr:Integrase/recombinase [Fructobacillus tropaeoli]